MRQAATTLTKLNFHVFFAVIMDWFFDRAQKQTCFLIEKQALPVCWAMASQGTCKIKFLCLVTESTMCCCYQFSPLSCLNDRRGAIKQNCQKVEYENMIPAPPARQPGSRRPYFAKKFPSQPYLYVDISPKVILKRGNDL